MSERWALHRPSGRHLFRRRLELASPVQQWTNRWEFIRWFETEKEARAVLIWNHEEPVTETRVKEILVAFEMGRS